MDRSRVVEARNFDGPKKGLEGQVSAGSNG